MKYLILGVSQQTDTMEMCMCVTLWLLGFRCLAEKVSIRGPSVHRDCLILIEITVTPHQLFVSSVITILSPQAR